MNIFYLDIDPVKSAQYQCNKHIVKMILESAQLLSTAHHVLGSQLLNFNSHLLYKQTHTMHPCAIWVREASENYEWLAKHSLALSDEYTFRYGQIHKSNPKLIALSLSKPIFAEKLFTSPPACMPDEYKVPGDIVASYRKYYKECKLKTIKCEWTRRERPNWL